MNLNIKDALYFILILIGLFLLFGLSQNGRYQTYDEKYMIDTRTGKTYESIVDGKKSVYRWDLITKEVE